MNYISLSISTVIIVVLSIVISFYLAIIIHELGHAVVGKFQGMALLNLSIGPIVFERENGRLRMLFMRTALGYAGRAVMYFPTQTPEKVMQKKLIRYVYGGPIVNIVVGIVSVMISFIWIHHPFYLIFGTLNLYLGITNLTSAQVKTVMTDGMHIKKLKNVPVEQSVMIHVHKQLTEDLHTDSPKDWHKGNIEKLSELMIANKDNMEGISLLPMISYYYFHQNESEIIVDLGKELAFNRSEGREDIVQDMTDISYATALLFTDELTGTLEIENKLEQVGKGETITFLKKQALVAYLQNKQDEAIHYLEEALVVLEKWHPLYLKRDNEKGIINKMIAFMLK